MPNFTRVQEAYNRYRDMHLECTGGFAKDRFTDEAAELFGGFRNALIDDTWEDSGNPRYPRPWTVWANDPERHVEIRDARNIEVICISDILRSRAIGDGQMIVDAIHERDRLKKVVASVRQQVKAAKEMYRLSTGNASALRKALEDTEELLEHFAKPGTMLHSAFYLHMRDNRAALAGPARNCDIYDAENGAAECMQAIDAAWYEIDTIRATIGWMLASVDTKGADDGI